MPKRQTLYIAVLFTIVLLAIGYVIYKQKSSTVLTSIPSVSTTKQFESDEMQFVISIPRDSVVKELTNSVSIETGGGTIWVTLGGTNFETFEKFWQDYKKGNSTFDEKRSVDGEWEIMSYKTGDRKVYILFNEGTYYTFSAEDDNLFAILDKIVQSFHYAP